MSVQFFVFDTVLCYWSILSSVRIMIHSRLPENFSESQAASSKHSHGQSPAVGYLRRVTEARSKLVNTFIKACKNCDFDFFHQ